MFDFLQQQAVQASTGLITRKAAEHVWALMTLTLLICGLCFYYHRTLRKNTEGYAEMPEITFLMFVGIQWIRRLTYQILGKSYRVFVPFFIYIILVLWFSNIIAILGFDSIGNSLVVPLSLTAVVFIGTLASGIFHRGRRFFGDYVVWLKVRGVKVLPIVDPLKLIGEASKLLSLTCRLWGNTLAGSLIIFSVYYAANEVLFNPEGKAKIGHDLRYLGPMIVPFFVFPLHIYFDIIGPSIQAVIFLILTICYWALAKNGEGASPQVGYDIEPEDGLQNNVN